MRRGKRLDDEEGTSERKRGIGKSRETDTVREYSEYVDGIGEEGTEPGSVGAKAEEDTRGKARFGPRGKLEEKFEQLSSSGPEVDERGKERWGLEDVLRSASAGGLTG